MLKDCAKVTRVKNGRIILPDGIVTGQCVYFADGKITAVTNESLPYDDEIDAEGLYVSAGFIDLHVHGGAGGDFADASPGAAVRAANHHFRHGATTIYPTICAVSADEIYASIQAVRTAAESGALLPCIAGVHLEGPYVAESQCGALNPQYITPPVKADYERILRDFGGFVARWTFAPELDGADEFLRTLTANGVTPSIGHTDAQNPQVEAAFAAGCRLVTHLYSAMSTVTRERGFRKLGVIESAYLLDEMAVEVIADGCHIPAGLFQLIYKIKGADYICLVTDAMRCSGAEGEPAEIGGIPCIIEDGVAKMPDRTAFAGSIATCDRLVRFCVKDAGIPLQSAVKMLTQTPARVMGLRGKGVIQAGYSADFALFDENVRIEKVFKSGAPHAC
jgi:N-acetylglucosamine-6-phosphate deacetylase